MIDPNIHLVMRGALAGALLHVINQTDTPADFRYVKEELRPVLLRGFEEKKMYAPILSKHLKDDKVKKEDGIFSSMAEAFDSQKSCCEKPLSSLYWVKKIEADTKGKVTSYELVYSARNGIVVTLAQVGWRLDKDTGEPNGTWQSQFTCKTDFNLTPMYGLQANIMQISWYFGLSLSEVYKQFKRETIF